MKKRSVRSGSTSVRHSSVSSDIERSCVDKLQCQVLQLQPALRKEQDRSRGNMRGQVERQNPSRENPFDKILLN